MCVFAATPVTAAVVVGFRPIGGHTHARTKTSIRPPGTIKIDDAQAEADDDDDDDDEDEEER